MLGNKALSRTFYIQGVHIVCTVYFGMVIVAIVIITNSYL